MRSMAGRRVTVRGTRRRLVVACAVACLLASPSAWANGRFPRSERLIEDPANHSHLLLAATYGLLTTTDRGAHWYHVCEAAFANDPAYVGDPILEVAANNALVVDVQSAIRRAPDACTWSTAMAAPSGGSVNDIAVDPQNRSTVFGVETLLAEGGTAVFLVESDDAGATWRQVGTALPLAAVETVDVDPTDDMHVYASGLTSMRAGALVQSHDRGKTWTSSTIPNTGENDVPFIAAIDPLDANKIFVRTDSTTQPQDLPEPEGNDALLYSKDGGNTWMEVIRQPAKLLGFALSPDGTTVLAGYGDTVESGIFADPTVTGIYQASTSDFAFSPVFSGSVTGLTWTASGVYACLAEPVSGTQEDLAFFANGAIVPDGAAPMSLMRLNQVVGPPPCCAGVDSVCDWTSVCVTYQFFACSGEAGAPSVACVDAGTAPGADASVGPGGNDGGGMTGADGGFDTTTSSGCGCRVVDEAGSASAARGWAALGAGAVGLMGMRRRRRRALARGRAGA